VARGAGRDDERFFNANPDRSFRVRPGFPGENPGAPADQACLVAIRRIPISPLHTALSKYFFPTPPGMGDPPDYSTERSAGAFFFILEGMHAGIDLKTLMRRLAAPRENVCGLASMPVAGRA